MKNLNVLVFPGGMENGIEIYNSLKFCKEIRLFSASSSAPNQAFYLYKKNNIVRDIHDENWISDLNKTIEQNKIDLIYPANSLIIDHLSQNADKIKTEILLPKYDVLELTRSKKRTINILQDLIATPKTYQNISEIKKYPIFVKPDRGYGSQGVYIANSAQEIANLDFNSFAVQEFLSGKEYTIDCFSDKNAKLLFSSGRERSRIRMGTSMHAELLSPEQENFFEEIANKILSKIKITGAWFFQMKSDENNNLKLLEIDVRIAGTMCFNRCRGINFPLLSIYQHFGHDVSTLTNNVKISLDRCLKNRYIFNYEYDTVYVDLDDTIIFRDHINIELISFLYQCVNNKIRLVLISKSLHPNKNDYLKKWRILELFDEIIWLKEEDKKFVHMKNHKAIYIDDSFSQRLETAQNLNIPTFDCSMIESLIDDRI